MNYLLTHTHTVYITGELPTDTHTIYITGELPTGTHTVYNTGEPATGAHTVYIIYIVYNTETILNNSENFKLYQFFGYNLL